MSWLDGLRDVLPDVALFDAAAVGIGAKGVAENAASLPLLEQWGGLVLIVLLVGGAVGFIYYLNTLFSSDYTVE